MAFIIVSLEGKATAGGYLKIDGGSPIALSDDLMIQVSAGNHYLEFSSQSAGMRGLANFNAAVGNYNTASMMEKNSVDGKISEYFDEKDVMLFTVISDGSGHVLDLPRYEMREMDADKYLELTEMYHNRIHAQVEHEKNTAGTEFLLCLLLGWLGVHKFYRGKYGAGVLYLFTCGVFCFGWWIDCLILLIKWIQSKRN